MIFNSEETSAVLSEAAGLLQASPEYDAFLAFLRKRGFGKLDSMKALVASTGMSLGDAKQTVHFSNTWRDRLPEDRQFHTALVEAAENLSQKHS